MNRDYDIKVTPTLLDAYEWMVSQDDEQAIEVAKNDLIAKLNRVQQPYTEAADRGTALNEIIDALVFQPRSDDAQRQYFGSVVHDNTYLFDGDLCRNIASLLTDAGDCQVYGSCIVKTPMGARVKVYGFADYVCTTRIVDLKSTTSYNVGKFRQHWQHICYPLMFAGSGMIAAGDYDHFDYLVVEVTGKNQPYKGEICIEDYRHTLPTCRQQLVDFLDNAFLPFVAMHRAEITDNYYFE